MMLSVFVILKSGEPNFPSRFGSCRTLTLAPTKLSTNVFKAGRCECSVMSLIFCDCEDLKYFSNSVIILLKTDGGKLNKNMILFRVFLKALAKTLLHSFLPLVF